MRYQRNQWDWETIKALLLAGVFILAAIAAVVGAIWYAYEAGGKLSIVITHNISFWIILFLAGVFGFFRKLTNPKEFMWIELPVQFLVSFVVITGLFALFFRTSTDLVDKEVWNGYTSQAEYYEEWTEECSRTVCDAKDKNGNCTSSHIEHYNVHHPPEWKVSTTAGDFETNKTIYRAYVLRFGNETKKDLHHANQVSHGDGDMFYARYDNTPDRLVPASREHDYVNYLRASDSIRKRRGNIGAFQSLIRSYPGVYSGQYGPVEINRVINAGVKLPKDWEIKLDRQMDIALTRLGNQKQVNIMIYLVNTADPKFGYALEQGWVNGKKNDVVVILGITNFPKVNFVHILAWTEVEAFKIELRDRLMNLPDLSNSEEVGNLIIDQVAKSPVKGGYERTPMAKFEYLVSEITLPWWCQVLIVILGGAASWLTSFLLVNNKWHE
jgi:hypothetical protein